MTAKNIQDWAKEEARHAELVAAAKRRDAERWAAATKEMANEDRWFLACLVILGGFALFIILRQCS